MQPVEVPHRRKRRKPWVIFLLVLMTVAGSWWYSRWKARQFAGTWQAFDGDQIGFTLKLDQDGSGKVVYPKQGYGNAVEVDWWLEGNQVVLYQPTVRRAGNILDNLVNQWQTWRVRRSGAGERWQIVKNSDGQIQLRSPSPNSARTLRKR